MKHFIALDFKLIFFINVLNVVLLLWQRSADDFFFYRCSRHDIHPATGCFFNTRIKCVTSVFYIQCEKNALNSLRLLGKDFPSHGFCLALLFTQLMGDVLLCLLAYDHVIHKCFRAKNNWTICDIWNCVLVISRILIMYFLRGLV